MKSDFARSLADLMRKYGNPRDSEQHASISIEIKKAVRNKDRQELLRQLRSFSQARNNTKAPNTQMVEFFCKRETKAVISQLEDMEEIPWGELADSLGLLPEPEHQLIQTRPESSPDSKKTIEAFLERFVFTNDLFTESEKDKIEKKVRSKPDGPWKIPNFVKSVSKNGSTVTVKTETGEAYIYL